MDETYNKLPEWLRWALFFPASLLLATLFWWSYMFILNYGAMLYPNWVKNLSSPVAFQMPFLFFIYLTIPRWKYQAVMFFFVLRTILLVVTMFVIIPYLIIYYHLPASIVNWPEYIPDYIGEITIIIASIYMLKEVKKYESNPTHKG